MTLPLTTSPALSYASLVLSTLATHISLKAASQLLCPPSWCPLSTSLHPNHLCRTKSSSILRSQVPVTSPEQHSGSSTPGQDACSELQWLLVLVKAFTTVFLNLFFNIILLRNHSRHAFFFLITSPPCNLCTTDTLYIIVCIVCTSGLCT